MFVELKHGERLEIGLRDQSSLFVFDYGYGEARTIAISADEIDDYDRGGTIYTLDVGESDNGEEILLNAIAHSRDEDMPDQGSVVVSLDAMRGATPVKEIKRDHAEVLAIADMLRAASSDEAVEVAFHRLARHLGRE